MTREQILALTAGAYLDGTVAEVLMNYPATLGYGQQSALHIVAGEPTWLLGANQYPITGPRYSLDIKTAWQVLVVMQARHIFLSINPTSDGYNVGDMLKSRHLVQHESAPVAICLSALLMHFELPGYEAEAGQMWNEALQEQQPTPGL